MAIFSKQIGVAVTADDNSVDIFRIDIDPSEGRNQQVKVAKDEVPILIEWLSEYLRLTVK